MTQKMINAGYKIVNFDEKADVYIINTCTVTNMADKKSRQMLRRVKEINPKSILVACGCYAQVAKNELEKIPEIDLILGINEKNEIAKYIEEAMQNQKNIAKTPEEAIQNQQNIAKTPEEAIQNQKNIAKTLKETMQNKKSITKVSEVANQKEFLDFGTVTYTEKTRAVIKVQDGCNQFCSYCIIPYARGRIRSRNPKSILEEIQKISKQGIKEVVITGIHVASYGKDFSQSNNLTEKPNTGYYLIDLLEDIEKIKEIERIRLGSLEPTLITKEFVQRLSKLSKICDQFHLSLQSGCNSTLKRMNRKYTVEEFEKGANLLKEAFPQVHLTTDIIVGFPGETDEEFKQTYKFLSKINFYKMHIFKYSPRKGTVAANMPNQIDGNKKEERSNLLIELSNKNEENFQKQYIGKQIEVLFEDKEGKYFKGHTTNYMVAKLKTEENLENVIKNVKVIGTENLELICK